MEKKKNLLKSAKFIVLGVFLVLSVVSILLMGTIKINYNISDYLDDSTDTKISLEIMEKEFGSLSNIQIMIKDISSEEADGIKSQIEKLDNVIFVNFDAKSSDYYKDNTALFTVMVGGNEYSNEAKTTYTAISDMLSTYGDSVEYGGTVVEKDLLRNAIQDEILLILVISLCLVAIIMLLTAASWLEPFVILAAAGVAVLINMGTNAIFGQISYITNTVAAILQLALSMDYSIMLLHSFRTRKKSNPELTKDEAMLLAIKDVVRPVSASALTTIAGLLALLFMSFRIGFDIGIVLMKSIVISGISAVTLLPVFLIFTDKLMEKTKKPALVIKERLFSGIVLKARKVVVPIAVVLIGVCCVLNFGNSFGFTDASNTNKSISDKFGQGSSLIVLYQNDEDNRQNEELLYNKLAEYKKENGEYAVKNFVSYGNTIGQVYDVEKASAELGIARSDAELLFTLYYFTDCSSDIKLDTTAFVNFAIDLINNDEDAKDYVSPETAETLELLLTLDVILDGEYTANELYTTLSELKTLDINLSEFAINQMYGLYFYDDIENKKVAFRDMLEFLLNTDYAAEYAGPETIEQLKNVFDMYDTIDEMNIDLKAPDTVLDYTAFEAEINRIAGIVEKLTGEKFELKFEIAGKTFGPKEIWLYVLNKKLFGASNTTITYSEMIMAFMNNKDVKNIIETEVLKDSEVTYEQIKTIASRYDQIYYAVEKIENVMESEYEYHEIISLLDDFIARFERLSEGLVEFEFEIPEIRATDIQQIYIMYFYGEENCRIPDRKIPIKEFLGFVLDTAENNETIKEQLPEDINIAALLKDADAIDKFLADKTLYNYTEMVKTINDFAGSISSVKVDVSIDEGATMGLYLKYAMANNLVNVEPIPATDLLNFVIDASESNPLLADRIDTEMRAAIISAEELINNTKGLLCAENYSRILLSVDLPAESEESTKFINYLVGNVKEIFGQNAYVAGEMATTNDLQVAFESDNKLISIFTVVSIFIIIMIVFKSISLPVILVAIIQGAIWIAMSASLLGEPMFFMSYIMTMCIMMGATIDYGILLSTNYIKLRKTHDKIDSLKLSLESSLPTVFTSGLILMISGFVVGLIASQKAISSVGSLLCRGTFVSIIMVTLVLPSVLYMLDKLVLKFTLGSKAKNKTEE